MLETFDVLDESSDLRLMPMVCTYTCIRSRIFFSLFLYFFFFFFNSDDIKFPRAGNNRTTFRSSSLEIVI